MRWVILKVSNLNDSVILFYSAPLGLRCQHRASCPSGISASNVRATDREARTGLLRLLGACLSPVLLPDGPWTRPPRQPPESSSQDGACHPVGTPLCCTGSQLAAWPPQPHRMDGACWRPGSALGHAHAISLTPCPLGMGSRHGLGQPTGSPAPIVPVALAGAPSSPLPCTGSCHVPTPRAPGWDQGKPRRCLGDANHVGREALEVSVRVRPPPGTAARRDLQGPCLCALSQTESLHSRAGWKRPLWAPWGWRV